MTEDARFEDASPKPLNLGAMDAEDLAVISALAQDAVLPVSELRFEKGAGRFALLLNRFRWEDKTAARPERVQSVLVFEHVQGVASQGIDRSDKDQVLSLLSVEFAETDAPSGHVVLNFAGDGAMRLSVEAIEATLRDVTRPYYAPSGKVPDHGA
ncbi:MAG: DUF2948 family protein [Pseudomonadota bacterium]|nr:DUF2948 family protein [Pseudomonadota bacterium]MEE3071032.1 DUF2948 family protein [Pseudomonadota bacterium]